MAITSAVTREGFTLYRYSCDNAPCPRVDQMPAQNLEELIEKTKKNDWSWVLKDKYTLENGEQIWKTYCPVCAPSKESDRTAGLAMSAVGCKEMLGQKGPTFMEEAERVMRHAVELLQDKVQVDIYDPLLCIMEEQGLIPGGWEVEFVPLHPLVDVAVDALSREDKAAFELAIIQIDAWIRAKGGEKWLPLKRIEDALTLRRYYTEQEIRRRRLQYELCPMCGASMSRRMDRERWTDMITCARCGWRMGMEDLGRDPTLPIIDSRCPQCRRRYDNWEFHTERTDSSGWVTRYVRTLTGVHCPTHGWYTVDEDGELTPKHLKGAEILEEWK